MKNKLVALFAASALCVPMFASVYMCLKLKNGKTLSYNVEDVEEISFTDDIQDASESELKFKVTSDSTAMVINDDSYESLVSLIIPSKIQIDGAIYNVTCIDSQAFNYYSGLTNINIPSSVDSIGNGAFRACVNLDVVIDNSRENVKIGNDAFQGCKSLRFAKDKALDPSVDDALISSLSFKILSDSTAEVSQYNDLSYYSHTNHDTSLVIPSKVMIEGNIYTVTGIGNEAFMKGVLYLKSISIPSTVTSIGDFAFFNCVSLSDLVIPSSVTSIGEFAFYKCSSLTSMVIPSGVNSIGNYTFYNCSSLSSIEIPSSVTSIGDFAFQFCSSLSSIEIPNNVTSIGDCAFYECSSLSSINIPDSVTNIGGHAFANCDYLEPRLLIYDNGTKCYGWVGPKDSCINVVIPEGITSIGDLAFYKCSSLSSINIPDNVTSIGSKAFADCDSLNLGLLIYDNGTKCYGWVGPKDSCISIVIPEGVTSIGKYAFNECSSLSSIDIPDSVTSIGTGAFSQCSSLSSIKIPDNVTSIENYTFSQCNSLPAIEIPVGVSNIGVHAFSYCTSLTSVEIPSNVTSIGSYAFYNDTKLDVVIDNSNDNVEIGDNAFNECKSVSFKK